jgi:RNA polymerase sigma-70 factor (ECF subfamily)
MWPDPIRTSQLLKQAERGDDDAVSQLLQQHRDPLRHAVGLRLDHALARRVDASDIVQEVLFEASRRLREYLQNPALPFHLWLRQIASDRLIDAHRRHRVAERRTIEREQPMGLAAFLDRSSLDLAASLRDPELTPAAAAMRQELERRFHSVLDQLEDDDREVLLMRYFERLSNSEVARAMGLSDAAASMRHLRALRRLRELLGATPSASGVR